MPQAYAKSSRSLTLRLSLACDLEEVRPVTLAVRSFLTEQGLSEEELMACELALAEACNNAIRYANEEGRQAPIEIDTICDPHRVSLCVYDHTPGFDWPELIDLPEAEVERGRGVFLIKSLMDEASYFRSAGSNCLVMQKRRFRTERRAMALAAASVGDLQQRLADSERIIYEMSEELSSCYESLSAIFRYSEQGQMNNLEDFVGRLLNDMLKITAADWYVLRLVPKEGTPLAVFAASEPALQLGPLEISARARPFHSVEVEAGTNRHNVWFDYQRPLEAADPLSRVKKDSIGLVHPFFFGETLIGTLTLGKTSPRRHFTAAQTNVVHTFADFLAIQIVNTRFQEERLNSLLVARDLEIAKNIQRSLLLTTLPQLPGFGLAGYCESAREVGGDFYDVLRFTEDSLLLIIADVMGKGIPAAMFAAILRSLLRAMPGLSNQPAALLTRVNRLLFEELSGVEMFITAQLVFVDATARKVVTASAGHCPALLAVASEKDVKTLSPEGMPLGVMADTTFVDETARLSPNCRVLLYTDGLPEARNPGGAVFGQERLTQWLKQTTASQQTAEELKNELVALLTRFQENTTLHDDQTFLIMAN